MKEKVKKLFKLTKNEVIISLNYLFIALSNKNQIYS